MKRKRSYNHNDSYVTVIDDHFEKEEYKVPVEAEGIDEITEADRILESYDEENVEIAMDRVDNDGDYQGNDDANHTYFIHEDCGDLRKDYDDTSGYWNDNETVSTSSIFYESDYEIEEQDEDQQLRNNDIDPDCITSDEDDNTLLAAEKKLRAIYI